MKKSYKFIIILLSYLYLTTISAQEIIQFSNPSFEYDINNVKSKNDWLICDTELNSKTNPSSALVEQLKFEDKIAFNGNTYMLMVAFDDGTFSSISQKLKNQIVANNNYSFDCYIGRKNKYKFDGQDCMDSLILKVWGGNEYCEKAELLSESLEITNYDWIKYTFQLNPEHNHSHITFEARFFDNKHEGQRGHLLIDLLSNIIGSEYNVISSDDLGIDQLDKFNENPDDYISVITKNLYKSFKIVPAIYKDEKHEVVIKPTHRTGAIFDIIDVEFKIKDGHTAFQIIEPKFVEQEKEVIIDKKRNIKKKYIFSKMISKAKFKKIKTPDQYIMYKKYKLKKDGKGELVNADFKIFTSQKLIEPAKAIEIEFPEQFRSFLKHSNN